MLNNLWVRFVIILTVLVACGLFAWPLDKTINLGLDLQGGMHLVYEVDADKAVLTSYDNTASDLAKYLKSKDVVVTGSARVDETVVIRFADAGHAEKAMEVIDEDYTVIEKIKGGAGDSVLTYTYTSDHRKRVYENAIDQALETLRNRIDKFGVSEPVIQREGGARILIQLPGVKDRERALRIIGEVANLEFRMLNEEITVSDALEKGAPLGSEILYQKEFDPLTKKVIGKTPHVVRKKVEVSGDLLVNAQVSVSNMNQPYVSIDFSREGAGIFARVTGENVNKRMAIVLDGAVYSAPVIKTRIGGGSAMIEGGFSYDEARDLALVLRAGALPAPLIKLEERSVGSSLGKDSVARGVNSVITGGIIVLIFMLVYYRMGGIVADFALLFNMTILAGALASFGATLTLPGIAGIILTIGMAVDANVLVFERIREEVRVGKTIRAAVESGFGKAFLTIIDANVTTLIAAVVLFQFGTGPVKGFAVTLSIGILASMFTAIFVSRTFFLWYLSGRRVTKLSI